MNLNNILLNVMYTENNNGYTLREYMPKNYIENQEQFLGKDASGNIKWHTILISNNDNNNENIFFDKNRIGIGRTPKFSYLIDIDCKSNENNTAVHIGDGTFGFSFGNATNEGFIPQIIGVGSKETNTSLYFLGISPNENESTVPLLVFDARNSFAKKVTNRPLVGFTSADYDNYSMLIDASNNLIINGNLHCNDIIINGKSLNDMFKKLNI